MKHFHKILSCAISFILCANSLSAILPDEELSLIDRSEFGDIFTDYEDTQYASEDEFLYSDFEAENTKENWDSVREAIETNALIKEKMAPAKIPQAIFKSEPEKPKPSIKMPAYGTSLSVTGRKIIGFEHTSKRYIQDQTSRAGPQSISSFNMQQQMQLKMQGKIGPKISINVDYDDTQEDKKDISIVYEGDKDEVVQSASFGDVDLSLPSTEFVSYNKQLFGIRMDLKYKNARAILIGSRTKGTGKTKRFVGNSLFQAKDILDISYIRRQYYDASFGDVSKLPIQPGTEKIYLDDQTRTVANGVDVLNLTVDDLASPTSTYNGNFRLLSPGIDYTVDYTKGVLTFNRQLNAQDVIAIDYTDVSGVKISAGTGLLKLIKTENDIPVVEANEAIELGYKRELKIYYSLGQTQIIRDNGLGNFQLRVQDANRNDTGSTLTPAQVYPDDIEVDFERGIFYLKEPFGGATTPDASIYASTPVSKYVFRVEFSSRIRTYFLEPDIVLGSDLVTVNGMTMQRNKDYFIDYETGFITFYGKVESSSEIIVNYDISPFGSAGTSALLGGRFSYDLGKHFTLGTTLLYETGSGSKTAPNITSMSESTMVAEADAKIKDLYILPKVKTSIDVEIAQSNTNPNVHGFAIVENMEGVKEEDFASTEYLDWRIASNPSGVPAHPDAISWTTQEVPTLEVNPGAQADANDKTRVLAINYDFTGLPDGSEISIVYPYRLSGVDFTRKNNVEMVIYADTQSTETGPEVNLHFGQVDEDSDNSGGVTLTCQNGTVITNAPKTEDINCDGILSAEEDIGWLYDIGTVSRRYGEINGIIDGQDLNNNGKLDVEDFTGGDFGYVNASLFTDLDDSTQKNQLDFDGWHIWKAPVVISAGQEYKWSAIRQVRISIRKPTGGKNIGTIKIAKLAAVGNSWQVTSVSPGAGLNLSGINNEDDPTYQPIFASGGDAGRVFDDLYGSVDDQKDATGSDNIIEQALELSYSASLPSTMQAQRKFTSPLNLSTHKELRFLLYNPAPVSNTSFFLRIGTDTDFQMAKISLDFSGWRLYKLAMADTNDDNIADRWENRSIYTNVTTTSAGTVNFQAVTLFTTGIETTDTALHSSSVWLNEVHLAEPRFVKGNAHKAQADFELGRFANFGAKYKYMDRNFQTPVTVPTNQDKEEQSAYFNLTAMKWMPVTANYYRQISNTPNPLDTQNNNLVNLTEKGVVDKRGGTVRTDIIFKNLPSVTLKYGAEKADYELLQRKDDKLTYGARVQHSSSKKSLLMPTRVDAGYSVSTSKTNYDENSPALNQGYYNLKETTHNMYAMLEFNPFKDTVLIPLYKLQEVKENRNNTTENVSYDKSMEQRAGLKGQFKIFRWLKPVFDYNIHTIENSNLTQATATSGTQSQTFEIGEIKTINRTASGNLNLVINAAELFSKSKLMHSFVIYSGYQLHDGDTWNNVENSLDTKSALWIRGSFNPTSPFARRTYLTLRDTVTSSQRWQPFTAYSFNGWLSALKGLGISNNISKSIQKNEVTGTKTKTISTTLPDLIVTLPDLEKLAGLGKWISDSTLNLKFAMRETENISVDINTETEYGTDMRFKLFNRIETSARYDEKHTDSYDLRIKAKTGDTLYRNANLQGSFIFKRLTLTPKINYTYERTTQTGDIITKEVTTTTPGLILKIDTNLPRGFTIPILNKNIKFKNRIIWTTNFNYEMKKSPVNILDNSDTFRLATDFDYEINKNLRFTLIGEVERLWHKYLKEEDFISLTFGSNLTLQF